MKASLRMYYVVYMYEYCHLIVTNMRRIKIVTLMVDNGMQFYNEFCEARCRSIDSWDSCSVILF